MTGKDMTATFEFADSTLKPDEFGPPISKPQIEQAIPELFPGKDGFARFYLRYNGLYIADGALFFRERFRAIQPGDYNRLGVNNFYFIPRFPGEESDVLLSLMHMRENLARRRPDLKSFAASHLPFAGDGSGNDFWIELATGRVKYRALEDFDDERDLVDVAPTFLDFAVNLECRSRQAPRPE
jgi:hypothetical protein